jgi:hypothetical protein
VLHLRVREAWLRVAGFVRRGFGLALVRAWTFMARRRARTHCSGDIFPKPSAGVSKTIQPSGVSTDTPYRMPLRSRRMVRGVVVEWLSVIGWILSDVATWLVRMAVPAVLFSVMPGLGGMVFRERFA